MESDLEFMRGMKKDLELQIQENRSLEETISGLRESEKALNQTIIAHEASNMSLEAELAKVHAELEQKAKELEVTEVGILRFFAGALAHCLSSSQHSAKPHCPGGHG